MITNYLRRKISEHTLLMYVYIVIFHTCDNISFKFKKLGRNCRNSPLDCGESEIG